LTLSTESLLVIAASLAGAVVSYVFNPLFLAPLLGKEGIATVGAFLFLYFALSFPQRPAGITIAKYVAHHQAQGSPGQAATVIANSLKKLLQYGFFAGIAVSLFSRPLARYLNLDSVFPVLAAVILAYAGLIFTAVLSSLQGLLRFRAYALLWLLDPVFRLFFGAGLVLAGFRISGVFFGYIGGYLAATGVGLWCLRSLLRYPRKEPVNPREMYAYSLPACAYSAYMAFVMSADGLMAKHYFPAAEAGIYVAASTIAKMMFVVIIPLINVSFSFMSDAVARRESPDHFLAKTLRYAAAGSVLMTLLSFAAPSLLIRLTYGPEFTAAGAILPLTVLALIPPAFAFIYSHYCMARNAGLFVYGLALGSVIHVMLLLLLHGSLFQLVLASAGGGMAECVLCVAMDFAGRGKKLREKKA
jgi:O-antigen/teichoic acid export membrane protein